MKTGRKLFLASFTARIITKVVDFVGKQPEKTRVAFISTAADPYEDKWFVDEDRNALVAVGYSVTDVDIKGGSEDELFNRLSGFDVLVFSGGNAFYLMEKISESGFDRILPKLLDKGVVYVGGSAGATVACPSLEPITTLDDPTKAPNLKSFEGMRLIDFVILPHYGEPKYVERYKKIVEDFKDFKFKILPITNNQAVIVEGKKWRVI